MKARLLQKLLNTKRTVQELSDKICISSYYVTDLIAVNKESLNITYAMDTFHEGKAALKSSELEMIWDKLEKIIANGTIKDIMEGNDPIDDMIEFYYFDSNDLKIVKSYTDKLEWPNVDYTGKIIYDNNCFTNENDCIKYAIKVIESNLSMLIDSATRFTTEYNETLNRINESMKRNKELLEKLKNERI